MLKVQVWEHPLLDMAHEAMEGSDSAAGSQAHAPWDTWHAAQPHAAAPGQSALNEAYLHCETITRESSKTFFMASSLLPSSKRRAARALYAFCRISDDLVDLPQSVDPTGTLDAWRQQVNFGVSTTELPNAARAVSLAWADARRAYRVPYGYVNQLIDGLALDLQTTRYETFSDLARYCYGVACTVGLMSMHITGYSGREAIRYAIRLGVALQLTNILRDIGEDWQAGRLYLPREDLAAFGLNETYLEEGRIDDRWRAFMRFQIARARRLYEESLAGVALLHRDGRFAIGAAGELYRGILSSIEANDYDVFTRRAALSKWGKLRRLPGIWLRTL